MHRRSFLLLATAVGLGAAGCGPRETPGPPARAWQGKLSILSGLPNKPYQTTCILGDGQVVIEEGEVSGSGSVRLPRRELPYTEARIDRADRLAQVLRDHPAKTTMCMDGAMATLELSRGGVRIERSYNCSDMETISETLRAIDDLGRG